MDAEDWLKSTEAIDRSSRTHGPDFICIGLQKAATGWLHDQLRAHTGFAMPPIKELHYFDRRFPELGNASNVIRHRRRSARLGTHNARDAAFLDAAFAAFTEPAAKASYAAIFAPAGDLRTGDVTPGYSTLSRGTIRTMADWLPDTRIVLLVRDPIDRFWSAVSMLWRRGAISDEVLNDPVHLRSLLATPRINGRSFPTEIAERWREAFGAERFGFFFFDDIASRPAETLAAILSFVGAAGGELQIASDYNRKATRRKAEMSPAIEETLTDCFRDELSRCRAMFGGHAVQWCAKRGL